MLQSLKLRKTSYFQSKEAVVIIVFATIEEEEEESSTEETTVKEEEADCKTREIPISGKMAKY